MNKVGKARRTELSRLIDAVHAGDRGDMESLFDANGFLSLLCLNCILSNCISRPPGGYSKVRVRRRECWSS